MFDLYRDQLAALESKNKVLKLSVKLKVNSQYDIRTIQYVGYIEGIDWIFQSTFFQYKLPIDLFKT